MSKADARVPLLQQLLSAQGEEGTNDADALPVQDIVWQSVTFACVFCRSALRVMECSCRRTCFRYAGWLQPNQGLGYASQQSGARVMPSSVPVDDDSLWVPVPSNIALSRARGWKFEDCRLLHRIVVVTMTMIITIIIISMMMIMIIIITHWAAGLSTWAPQPSPH
jgi:hypothetical protein